MNKDMINILFNKAQKKYKQKSHLNDYNIAKMIMILWMLVAAVNKSKILI